MRVGIASCLRGLRGWGGSGRESGDGELEGGDKGVLLMGLRRFGRL
jgi:hypothetical protein